MPGVLKLPKRDPDHAGPSEEGKQTKVGGVGTGLGGEETGRPQIPGTGGELTADQFPAQGNFP